MIVQDIYLPEYDWHCKVFYSVTTYWVEDILDELKRIGCSDYKYSKAKKNLQSGELNTGLTYSNAMIGESLMVIAKTSS